MSTTALPNGARRPLGPPSHITIGWRHLTDLTDVARQYGTELAVMAIMAERHDSAIVRIPLIIVKTAAGDLLDAVERADDELAHSRFKAAASRVR